jgi:phenylpropionate dioxygenase-like ring-hydroxylating dioxygenase large terminal subunit
MSSAVFSREEVAATLRPREQATWLPRRAYVDEAVYKEEMRAIFEKEWMAIFHHTLLPNVGDYKTQQVAGRPLLFVRDQDKKIRCYVNICRHRGMAIASGSGNCKGFVCPYHTWGYDLNGVVIHTPQINGAWKDGHVRLTEVKTEIFLGFVFINYDMDAASVASKLPTVAADLKAWGDADLEVMFEKVYTHQWNWKIMADNSIEAYHVMGLHASSAEDDIPTDLAYVTVPDDGQTHAVLHQPFAENRKFKPSGSMDSITKIPNLPAWMDKELRFYDMWPCSIIWARDDMLVGYFIVPGDTVDEIEVLNTIAIPRGIKSHPDYPAYRDEWIKFQDLIQQEDMGPCARVQRSYARSNEWKPGPYSPTEATCWFFHRWYLDKLGNTSSS